jgi:hypothetical protein
MPSVHTRHKATTGRCADSAGRVKIGELHALGCHTIDTWRLKVLLPEAGEISVTGVIDHDVDEIRLTGSDMGKGKGGGAKDGQGVNVLHGLNLFWVKVRRDMDNHQDPEVTQKVHLPGKDSM